MNSPVRPPLVLVVDDDAGILQLERLALSRAGHEVATAMSADEALASIAARAPDLIVTDYRLGGTLTGLDVLRRTREGGSLIPAILVTAFSDEQRILEALRAGVRDVIPKAPGFLDYLPAAVNAAIAQRRAEQEAAATARVRESERYFRRLAESLPQLVWTARADGVVDYYNSRHSEFAGIAPTADGGSDWSSAIHPEDVGRTAASWNRAIATGQEYEVEHRIRRADGTYRWYVSRGVPFRDDAGRITRWYGSATDVHDVKIAEERIRLATEAARMFAFEWDAQTDAILRSRECLDILGTDAGEEERATRYLERVHPEDRAALTGAVAALTREAPGYHVSYRVVRRDGRVVCLDETARATFTSEGRVARVIGMTADVTERCETERRLTEVTALLRVVADTTPDLIYMKDRSGRLMFANPGMLAVIGKPAEEVWGRTEREFALNRNEAETIIETDERIMRTGVGESVQEQITGPAGTRIYLSTKSPLREAGGDVIGLVGISSDVTSRVRAEEERQQLLAREQAARAEAERANVLKDQFLATLSHELRTPLNAVLGWVQILLQRPFDDERRVRSILETIFRNAQAQARLIEDLLDMSRIVSGTLRMDVQPVHLPDVVGAALESIGPAAEAKRIRVSVRSAADDSLVVSGDPARLQQVVWNLLSNGVKFTPPDGAVDVHVSRMDGRVRLEVTDSGPGLPPDFLPHVFERFRQADATSTRAYGGLGLGLSIARHLIELHGGHITAENTGPGGGARFAVDLPAVPTASGGRSASRQPHLS